MDVWLGTVFAWIALASGSPADDGQFTLERAHCDAAPLTAIEQRLCKQD